MNIYIGHGEIAGYFSRLKKGFDKLEVKADFWAIYDNKYQYEKNNNFFIKLHRKCFVLFKKQQLIYSPLRIIALLIMLIINAFILLYAILKYDVFILNSQSLFNLWELKLLKFFNKKIIVVFLGSDSRPSYLSGNYIQGKYAGGNGIDLCYKDVKKQTKRIKQIEKYADNIINHLPSAHFLSKPFIPWLNIGFPFDVSEVSTNGIHSTNSNKIKILHAPSNFIGKGSQEIIKIVEKLKNNGLQVEMVTLKDVPNEKVISEIAKCDIVVDELYSDISLGGLGTEAAFSRKPVINSGYYWYGIVKDNLAELLPPSIYCYPDKLEETIAKLVNEESERFKDKGEKLFEFVNNNWECAIIGKKYLKIIEGEFPNNCYGDPKSITYYFGYGISMEKLQQFLKLYVGKYGQKALFLDNNPEVKKRILTFLKVNLNND